MRLMRSIMVMMVLAALPRAQPAVVDPESLGVPQLLEYYHVPAVGIALIHDSKIAWARAWGVKDARTGEPATVDTLFQAASISKPVAAMASLRAIQDGRFSLDQDINSILTSWRLPPREGGLTEVVTPRMLMSHMSGLDDRFGFPGYPPGTPRPTTVQILDGVPPSNRGPVRLGRPPMSGSRYSGGGVTLQELALSDVLGKPFPRIMRELVLDPIGMADSTYEQPLPAGRERQAAHAHNESGEPHRVPWHVYPEHAAAGLWTTPSDLARFAIDVQLTLAGRSSRVLTRAMAREMVTPVGSGRYGVGFFTGITEGGSIVGEALYFSHSGGNLGFGCELVAHRTKGYGVVLMTNGDNGSRLIINLRSKIARAAAWDLYDKASP